MGGRYSTWNSRLASSWMLRIGVIATAIWAIQENPFDKPLLHVCLGIFLLVACLWPLDRWLRSPPPHVIPVFELHLFFYAATFGLAAFIDPPLVQSIQLRVNEASYSLGLTAALLGVIGLYVGYGVACRFRGRWWTRLAPRFPVGADYFAVVYLYPGALVASLLTNYLAIAALEQALLVIRLFCFIWALNAALSGAVARKHARFVFLLFLPIEVIAFSGLLDGFLVGILTYGELIVVAFVLWRKKVPVGLVAAGVAAFLVLQPVKNAYRSIVWHTQDELPSIERIELLGGLALDGKNTVRTMSEKDSGLQKSYARLHNVSVTSSVIQAVEADGSYWGGATYLPLFTKWIPRVFWPGKPVEDLGNEWARRYGLLTVTDFSTSFNLLWLPEMFMNFGWIGVLLISILVGLTIGTIKRGVVDRVKTPVEVAFAYMVSSVFFWPESNLSIGVGGIAITWITVSVLLFGVRVVQRVGSPRATVRG